MLRAILCDNCGQIAVKQKNQFSLMTPPKTIVVGLQHKALCKNCSHAVDQALEHVRKAGKLAQNA